MRNALLSRSMIDDVIVNMMCRDDFIILNASVQTSQEQCATTSQGAQYICLLNINI